MTINEAVENILFSEQDFFLIKQSIERLKDEYADITGVTIGDMVNPILETEKGIVVSLDQAAHCLVDLARTTYFLRGIFRAIEDTLKTQPTVTLLYAGCGPYATLVSPLTTQFSSSQLSITLVDINKVSLESVKKVIKSWEVKDHFNQVLCADLTDAELHFDQKFDIIISETMQCALKNECQVPITRNLIRFLDTDGIFIPESIKVDACLVNSSSPEFTKSKPKLTLGNLYDLTYKAIPEINLSTVVGIPETDNKLLQLFTSIQVYKDIVIEPFDSGLTMPFYIDFFNQSKPDKIKFQYVESARPDWEIEYIYLNEKDVPNEQLSH